MQPSQRPGMEFRTGGPSIIKMQIHLMPQLNHFQLKNILGLEHKQQFTPGAKINPKYFPIKRYNSVHMPK